MSGINYLLDTNFVLGLLKSTPEVIEILSRRQLLASNCAFSAVTRMELLGFPGLTADEEQLISDRLADMVNKRFKGLNAAKLPNAPRKPSRPPPDFSKPCVKVS